MNAELLREAARYMRATLCYGGSADLFYTAIADWWEREAGQEDREVSAGFTGVADDMAVRAALAYLPGARAWLNPGLNRPHMTTASGVNAEQVDLPHGTDDVPVEAKGAALNAPAPLVDSNFGEASA